MITPEQIREEAYNRYPEALTYNEMGELYDFNAILRIAYINGFKAAIEKYCHDSNNQTRG